MDMNELYLVAVRLRGWEFMAEASHINANKAVRGLAEDLQDFYDEGQCSSAAHLMQQGPVRFETQNGGLGPEPQRAADDPLQAEARAGRRVAHRDRRNETAAMNHFCF